MSTILRVSNATKRFGATQALAGAAMDLRRGEFLGLLGPNGAGKTTLIRAIAGRVRLDGGEIRLFDTDISRDGPAAAQVRRRLGIVPQEIALYPSLTAYENLLAFGELNGLRGSVLAERCQWGLQFAGLAQRASEPVKGYSGGMKRRLNIACGILHKPDVILLDEPTVGVDPQSRARIWEMLNELKSQGAALLLTSHQLDEVQQICERIVIIDHGQTIADGTFAQLVEQTVGAARRVSVQLRPTPNPGGPSAPRAVSRQLNDLGAELPTMLTEIRSTGDVIEDVHIEAPSLQAVFLHLTGRELRE